MQSVFAHNREGGVKNILCKLGFHKMHEFDSHKITIPPSEHTEGDLTIVCGGRTFLFSDRICSRCGVYKRFQVYENSKLELECK